MAANRLIIRAFLGEIIAGVSTDLKAKAGLEDVVATSSAICYIDGERGILSYRRERPLGSGVLSQVRAS